MGAEMARLHTSLAVPRTSSRGKSMCVVNFLQSIASALESSMKDEKVDKAQLEVELKELQEEKKEAEARQEELKVTNHMMLLQQLLLMRNNEMLQEKARQLDADKAALTKQIHKDELMRKEKAMASIKDSVQKVLQRLLDRDMTEEEAQFELGGLGFEVKFVEPASVAIADDTTAACAALKEDVWNGKGVQRLVDREMTEEEAQVELGGLGFEVKFVERRVVAIADDTTAAVQA
eukprot:gene21174-28070_t